MVHTVCSKNIWKFAKDWGFQHIPNSPEYLRSNGLAEKTVQIVKYILEKAEEDSKDPYLAMLEVRNTPVDYYKSPAELAFGRQLQSILPVSPNSLIVKSVDNNEFKQRSDLNPLSDTFSIPSWYLFFRVILTAPSEVWLSCFLSAISLFK